MIGRYYSIEWVRKNVLMQSEEDIETLDKQMETEKASKSKDDEGASVSICLSNVSISSSDCIRTFFRTHSIQ
jgi:hypothetical protein